MSVDFINSRFERSKPSLRPVMRGTRGMVSSGHHLATQAGVRILERGGNAIDAGVAAGICLGVLHTDLVNFGGVAPILIYHAGTGKVKSISGLGFWPRGASVKFFEDSFNGEMPPGVHCSVIPAAPDAWIQALLRFGTMSFEEVSRDAIEYAEHGFPVHHLMANNLKEEADQLRKWKSSRDVFMPGGRTPEVGEILVQRALADTLKQLVRAERARRFAGREAALQAARDEFYKGEIAEAIVDFHKKHDGLIGREDLAAYQSEVEDAPKVSYQGYDFFACGAWCQGPSLLQALNMLEGFDLGALGHNSPAYAHTLLEVFKLAFSDRDAYIADPRFRQVPLKGLLAKQYAKARRAEIRPEQAWTEMPPAGDPWKWEGGARKPSRGGRGAERLSASGVPGAQDRWDTSYLAAMDRWGNAFSATPSDSPFNTPILPQLGIICSGRGTQSWVDAGHPCSVEPGKRPRLTPNPAFVMKDGKPFLAFGTPGGDVQIQSMAQYFLNIVEFGMDPQEAVEAPRFATSNFPGSFYPHDYHKGLAMAERRLGQDVLAHLEAVGNTLKPWEDFSWRGGGICAVMLDEANGVLLGAADPRREGYALGW
jgi:gamma-glutamyltranspeptidase/glutathione hydrolase